jgi:hypothetical protein
MVEGEGAQEPAQTDPRQSSVGSQGDPVGDAGSAGQTEDVWVKTDLDQFPGPVDRLEPARGGVATPDAVMSREDGNLVSVPPRRRDQLLWLWPVGVLLLMVLAGRVWGPIGTLVTAATAIGTLALFIGDVVFGLAVRVCIASLAVLLVAAALIGHKQSWIPIRSSRLAAAAPHPSASEGVINLSGKRVTLSDLKGKNLKGALMAGADLSGLDLYGMNLNGIVAPGASFQHAILDRASLIGADLRGANLSDSCMHGAVLEGAQLAGANAAHADVTNVAVSPAAIKSAAVWPRTRRGAVVGRCG